MALPELQDNIGSPAGALAPKSLGSMLEGLGADQKECGLTLPELQDNIGSPAGAEAPKSLGFVLEGLGFDRNIT